MASRRTEHSCPVDCTWSGHGARIMPRTNECLRALEDAAHHLSTAGTITAIQFMKTPGYIQITGLLNQAGVNLDPNDSGGELDPHGVCFCKTLAFSFQDLTRLPNSTLSRPISSVTPSVAWSTLRDSHLGTVRTWSRSRLVRPRSLNFEKLF